MQTSNATISPRELKPWLLFNFLWTYRLFILVIALAIPAVTSLWISMSKSSYRTSVLVNIDLTQSDRDVRPNAFAAFNDQQSQNKINFSMQYFDSPSIRLLTNQVLKDPQSPLLNSRERAVINQAMAQRSHLSQQQKVDWIFSNLDIRPTADRSRLEITSVAHNAELAAALANLGARCLVELNHRALIKEIVTLKEFLQTQTKLTKQDLVAFETQLAELQRKAKIVSVEDMRSKVSSSRVDQKIKYSELKRDFSAINIQIADLEKDLTQLKSNVRDDNGVSKLYIDQIERRLEVLRFEKAQSGLTREPANADTSAIDVSIAQIHQDLDRQLNSNRPMTVSPWDYIRKIEATLFDLRQKRIQLGGELKSYQATLGESELNFSNIPEQLRDLTELKRTIELTSNLYTSLKTREQEARIREAAHPNDLVIITPALIPKDPSGPGFVKAVLFSFFGGLALALFVLFTRYVSFPLVRETDDLTSLSYRSLGAMPRTVVTRGFLSLQTIRYRRLRTDDKEGRFLYALELIRMRLQKALSDLKSANASTGTLITFNSSNRNEGRTFIAANIADLWASKNKRVCLLDFTFSSRGIRSYFEPGETLESRPFDGFELRKTKLATNLDLYDGTVRVHESNPEAYEAPAFLAFLDELRAAYDLVIVDLPNIRNHAEALIVLQKSDAVVTVVNQRETLMSDLAAHSEFLATVVPTTNFSILNFAFDDFRSALQGA